MLEVRVTCTCGWANNPFSPGVIKLLISGGSNISIFQIWYVYHQHISNLVCISSAYFQVLYTDIKHTPNPVHFFIMTRPLQCPRNVLRDQYVSAQSGATSYYSLLFFAPNSNIPAVRRWLQYTQTYTYLSPPTPAISNG